MSDLNRVSVLQWLRELPESELLHLLTQALEAKSWRQYEIAETKYAIAQAWRDDGEEWNVRLVARHDHEYYGDSGFETDHSVIRAATCKNCGHFIGSWATFVKCPVCATNNECY